MAALLENSRYYEKTGNYDEEKTVYPVRFLNSLVCIEYIKNSLLSVSNTACEGMQ